MIGFVLDFIGDVLDGAFSLAWTTYAVFVGIAIGLSYTGYAGWILALIPVFIGMAKLRGVQDREMQRHKSERQPEDYKNMGLTCNRCGKMAYPLHETKNRYKCGQCEHQFAGAHHGY